MAIEKELELAGLETTNNATNSNLFSQTKDNCENHSSARQLGKQIGKENSLWGFQATTKKLVSQAVSSYHSLASELEPKPQESNHKAEHHQQDLHREPKLQQVEYIQSTMTAQENAEPALPASAPVYSDSDNPAGKPIPQAVLVYHESAHSIVFRDHLRRQQGAIRRASSKMENSSHHGRRASPSPSPDNRRGGANHKQHMQPVTEESTPAPSREASSVLDVSESDIGYESGGSRGSIHSTRSGGDSSSVTSGGSRAYRKVKSGLSKATNNKKAAQPAPEMQAVVIANFQPVVEPLEALDLNSSNVYEPLMEADPFNKEYPLEMTEAEKEVVELLKNEQAVVKTIRNADWTAFLQKFKPSKEGGGGTHEHHPAQQKKTQQSPKDTKASEIEYPFNSFVTSTSLLPSCAKKMRCFGSTNEYAIGVVFGMPTCFPDDDSEDAAAKHTKTWSWPSGYSAKTEFNIDHHGNLTNGREEALVPLSGMRRMNHAYLYDKDYIVGGRMVKGGLTTIPYNEVYIRVGGLVGRVANGLDLTTGKKCNDADSSGKSFDHGIGLPIALFVREADYGHLVRLLRTRARYSALFGADSARGIPLLYITPESGVRVFTEKLQQQVLKTMAWDLNPFQNPSLSHRTGIDNTSETHLQQKLEELLDLDDDNMEQILTPEERARIAGGFGATDESVANMLNQAMQRDISEGQKESTESGHNLQDLVNEGLSFALRANDYHTSRQLLILYTLVAARGRSNSENTPMLESKSDEGYQSDTSKAPSSSKNWRKAEKNMEGEKEKHRFRDERTLGKDYIPAPPPPPPLDTDRLRSATNSDGLLAVLGAAQVLRAMQDGSAKRRVKESIDSIEE